MELPPFLLDRWLAAHEFASTAIRYNLASSTGPKWTVRELLSLGGARTPLDDLELSYGPPQGNAAFREAIGAFHGVDPDWVVVTTGASEAFSILLCLAARPAGNTVLPTPAFPGFDAMAGAWGLGVRHYDVSRSDGYRLTSAQVLRAVDANTVLAVVNTPHNPTGAVAPRDQIAELAGELAPRGSPLVVDEVYHPLYFGGAVPSTASLDNVIVISDTSKALSLPGLRVGWIIDSNAERRERIIDARSYFTISSSPVAEALATHALANRDAILGRLHSVATANLDTLVSFVARSSGILSWVKPRGGTIAFPWFEDGRDTRSFCETLARAGVLVAPGDCFARPEHFRIGFGAQANGFEDALAIVERTLRNVPA